MILKIESNSKYVSFIQNNSPFDRVRDKTYKVKIFGIVIFERRTIMNADYTDPENNVIGFKK
jgi:hypothetical protein